ncbi:MAG TPA: hypothetical protein VGK16_07200 [Candidatus Limnocylindrales bacterium]
MSGGSGRLSSPGEHAARARVEAVYEAVDRLSASDLNEIPAPPFGATGREGRLDELERLADGSGRRPLLDEARDALANAILARFAGIRPYPYSINPTGAARVEDQAVIIAVLRDLVAVAVMQDRLEPEDARALARPGLRMLGSRASVLDDRAWEDLLGPADAAAAVPEGAPREEDWVAADEAARVAGRDPGLDGYAPPGTRLMRRAFFGVVAVVGVVGAVAWGFGERNLPVALLAAGAVLALCWTFATWSPRRR